MEALSEFDVRMNRNGGIDDKIDLNMKSLMSLNVYTPNEFFCHIHPLIINNNIPYYD